MELVLAAIGVAIAVGMILAASKRTRHPPGGSTDPDGSGGKGGTKGGDGEAGGGD
jgi:hypothetical protein